ncbi:MAG: phosphatidylserine decarboxylase family protein [Halanaerobiales bacterium]
MINKYRLNKEAYPLIIVTLAILIISLLFFKPLAFLSLLALIIFIVFFRDPERNIPEDEKTIVAPADGKIMAIETIYESTFLEQKAYKITIFLSIFNVHINRSPIQGKIQDIVYKRGRKFPAFSSKAAELNESNTIFIKGTKIDLIVRQIAGIVARRIVCYAKCGDTLQKGERLGLIKFGSATEIIIPHDINIKVAKGDKVFGGESIIGVIPV